MFVEEDGYVCPTRDPPGQLSIYITPGDPRREVYRLSTFEKYPLSAKQNPWKLVKAGFHYTGYKDRVKCGRCGKQVADWQEDDNPNDAKWHEVWCQFDGNNKEHNIPVSDVRRLRSPEPAYSEEPGVAQIMTTQSQVRTTPQLAVRTIDGNLTGTLNRNDGASRHAPQSNTWREMYPCMNPLNPHMSSYEQRLSTFEGNAVNWQRNNIRATMQNMARAGLYYLGTRDRVKCWYCNGGLQNWALYDDPWFEHAKWFPTCEFVLRNKGPEFVEEVSRRFPNIGRENELTRSRRPKETFTEAKVIIIDYGQQKRELQQRALIEVETSMAAQEALKMGFSKKQVTNAVERQLKQFGRGFEKVTTLVNELLEETPAISEMMSSDEETEVVKKDDPLKQLETLKREKNCRKCQMREAVVMLLPCGHLSTCEECQGSMTWCPTCGEKVQEKIRTYRV